MVFSKKELYAIESILESIENGNFDETNIKMLMVHLRGFYRNLNNKGEHIRKYEERSNKHFSLILKNRCIDLGIKLNDDYTLLDEFLKAYSNAFKDFPVICDSFFHSYINRGKSRSCIKSSLIKLETLHENRKLINSKSVLYSCIFIDLYVDILKDMAYSYLRYYKSQFDINNIENLFQIHKQEIGLCIMSLLQYVTIDLKNGGKEQGQLFLRSVKCKYSLYCRVFKSDIGEVVVPVGYSQVKDIDGILFDSDFFTQLIQTYRDDNGLLRIREVSRIDYSDMIPIYKPSIIKNYKSLVNGTFTEDNIKELIIDLREQAKSIIRTYNNQYVPFVGEFDEISDFYGHPFRDQGLLSKRINKYFSNLKEMFPNTIPRDYDGSILEYMMDISFIINGLILTLIDYFESYGIYFSSEDILKIFKFKDDIALCIISLLQDYKIKLGNYKYHDHFMIVCIENKLHLDSMIILAETKTKTLHQFYLPVIETNVKNTYNLEIKHELKELQIIETYRDKPNEPLKIRVKD
jgi:hypothetical protein